MRVGVAFFHEGNWLHCGLTDGTRLIDSQPGIGVTMRPLPRNVEMLHWLPGDNGHVWHAAHQRIGEPFTICAAFVCQCMGDRCILPSTLSDRLAKLS